MESEIVNPIVKREMYDHYGERVARLLENGDYDLASSVFDEFKKRARMFERWIKSELRKEMKNE